MKKFRINFGNGQVSNTFNRFADAKREMLACDCNGGMCIQQYVGDGMWVRARERAVPVES